MGFHPNDKRSQVIRSKTHTTFFIFLLDKVKYFDCTVFRSENMKVNRNCPNREDPPIV